MAAAQLSPAVSLGECEGRWSTLVEHTPAPLVLVLTKILVPTRVVLCLEWDMELEVGKALLNHIPKQLGWHASLTRFCAMIQMLEEKIAESEERCRLMFIRNPGLWIGYTRYLWKMSLVRVLLV